MKLNDKHSEVIYFNEVFEAGICKLYKILFIVGELFIVHLANNNGASELVPPRSILLR